MLEENESISNRKNNESMWLLKKKQNFSVLLTPATTEVTEECPLLENIRVVENNHNEIRMPETPFTFGNKTKDWRNEWVIYLETSITGRYWEIFDAFVNIIFVILYIINTTFGENGSPLAIRVLDVFLASILLIQFLPRMAFAQDWKYGFISYFSTLTFLSTIPVFIAFSSPKLLHTYMSSGYYVFIYPVRFMRLHLAIVQCLIPSKTSIFKVSLIARKAIKIIGFIFFLLLTVTAFVHIMTYMEDTQANLTFFDAFFFSVVSSTTGLSTSIKPDTVFSRLVILYVMACAAIFLPTRVSELFSLIRKKSAYDHSYKGRKGYKHVIVSGSLDTSSLISFLKEFFSVDHKSSSFHTHVVILNPEEPSEEIQLILEDPSYTNKVHYVKGSAIDSRSLEKVKAKNAEACFIFCSKYCTTRSKDDDAKTVMRALAIKKHVANLPLHIQVLLPEHKCYFDFLATSAVCTEEIKLGILAQNSRCPGFTTLLFCLTTTISNESSKKFLKFVQHEEKWIKDYVSGANQEIYPTILPQCFSGTSFVEISLVLFEQFSTIMFAIAIPNQSYFRKIQRTNLLSEEVKIEYSDYDLFINPGIYICQGGELAFVIAGTEKMSGIITTMESQEWERIRHSREDESKSQNSEKASLSSNTFQKENPKKQYANSLLSEINVLNKQQVKAIPVIPQKVSPARELLPEELSDGRKGRVWKRDSASTVAKIFQQAMGKTGGLFAFSEKRPLSKERSETNSMQDFQEAKIVFDRVPKNVKEHILLLNTNESFPNNLEYFIAPLRSPHVLTESNSGNYLQIVILTPVIPSQEQISVLEKFDDIFVVQGNPLSRRDLHRAGVERIKKAVVLANPGNFKEDIEKTADASTLLIVLNIEAMAEDDDVFIVSEFVHPENMKYIGELSKSITKRNGAFTLEPYQATVMRPAFMAGHVYSPSLIDTIICQNYYNPHLLNIVRHLIFSGMFCEYNSSVDSTAKNKPLHSHIWHIPVPEVFHGENYMSLYKFLSTFHEIIPLGLYRIPETSRNRHRYVYINPKQETILQPTDFAYVLSRTHPVF